MRYHRQRAACLWQPELFSRAALPKQMLSCAKCQLVELLPAPNNLQICVDPRDLSTGPVCCCFCMAACCLARSSYTQVCSAQQAMCWRGHLLTVTCGLLPDDGLLQRMLRSCLQQSGPGQALYLHAHPAALVAALCVPGFPAVLLLPLHLSRPRAPFMAWRTWLTAAQQLWAALCFRRQCHHLVKKSHGEAFGGRTGPSHEDPRRKDRVASCTAKAELITNMSQCMTEPTAASCGAR